MTNIGIKPTALSDDELKEVSGGMIVNTPRIQKCEDKKTKDSCQKAKCSWNSSTSKCG